MSTLPDWDHYARAKIRHAQAESDKATSRLQGMKIRANMDAPKPASGGFPYPARTCAEWGPWEPWAEGRNR